MRTLSTASLAALFGGLTALTACGPLHHTSFASTQSESGYVNVVGARLYYESVGSGSPVVLLHGGNLDSRMWDTQFALLAREHRVIRYDARGFGRSTAANKPYSAHEDLLALLESLHVPRASLVGLSLGGRVAIDFALAHPSRVERLVLASPGMSGWGFHPGDTTWAPQWRSAQARRDSVGMATAWLGSDFMKPAMEQPELRVHLLEWIKAGASYWMGLVTHGDTEVPAQPPALGRTALIQAPTLVIVGSRDVPDILQIADTLVATIHDAQRLVFGAAGHMVNLEQPERFNAAVGDFLRGPTPASSRPRRYLQTSIKSD